MALKRSEGKQSDLLELKLKLAKNLLNKGFKKEKVRALMNFLRFYVRLNPEKSVIFEKHLETITGKINPMGIEELILEQERKVGEKVGEKRGEKRGELKRTIEVVLASHDNGLEPVLIAKITRLTEKQVLKILQQNDRI